jgi:hypothetical protein
VVRKPVDSSALAEVSAALEGLSETMASVEDDLLSCLVVMGEPHPQHVVDAWVDQVVDLVRAVDELTGQHLQTLARASSRHHARRAGEARAEQPLAHPTGPPWLERTPAPGEQR